VIILENGCVVSDGAPLTGGAANASHGHLEPMPKDATERYNRRETGYTDIPLQTDDGEPKEGEAR